ncbi:unnamed protein product, partial [Ectocarpus sp. 12 AP-2014]
PAALDVDRHPGNHSPVALCAAAPSCRPALKWLLRQHGGRGVEHVRKPEDRPSHRALLRVVSCTITISTFYHVGSRRPRPLLSTFAAAKRRQVEVDHPRERRKLVAQREDLDRHGLEQGNHACLPPSVQVQREAAACLIFVLLDPMPLCRRHFS